MQARKRGEKGNAKSEEKRVAHPANETLGSNQDMVSDSYPGFQFGAISI